MNLALRIVAGLLAAALLVSSAKIIIPREKMAAMRGLRIYIGFAGNRDQDADHLARKP
ncbi:hypothetical protein [Nocardia sp. CC227C]|uniref:hypothetical protein n=1 Tax=Nocardia sp. CC227C TaxID=3044562 RepID=UPI00278BB3FF|nr:hypothetical protein [Nocardia sp. CC227C]